MKAAEHDLATASKESYADEVPKEDKYDFLQNRKILGQVPALNRQTQLQREKKKQVLRLID